jgi:hypothetical protein
MQPAVEDGVAACDNLLSKLTDIPTPAGPTPRQIGAELVQLHQPEQLCQLPDYLRSSLGARDLIVCCRPKNRHSGRQ